MSARKLTDGHMAKVVRAAREGEVTDPKKLGKDQMRLYSFYKPSLQADDYVIEVTQSITSGTNHLQVNNTKASDSKGELAPQEFEVVVPRFTLDRNLINSYYPPDGHQDEGRILPHVVLNDPHYPWEIAAGTTDNLHSEIDLDPEVVVDEAGHVQTDYRGLVPFEKTKRQWNVSNGCRRLFLTPETSKIDYLAGFVKDTDDKDTDKYKKCIDEYNKILQMSDSVDIIFPKKDLVRTVFTDATRKDTATHKFGIEQYKYLAHVRHINTEGCPDAGIEEEGLFSVVISSRTGALRDSVLQDGAWTELPSNLSQPRTQVCHLVSIEHLDATMDKWVVPTPKGESDRIGLVSLFSWVYTALPPDPVNFVTTVRNLTEKQQMLRADDSMLAQIDAANSKAATSKNASVQSQVSNILADRLKRGYTVARWRTQTGEETSAFTRGPLVPLKVPSPPAKNTIPDCSNTSQDYQVLDPQTGLMDLSYSSAWQVGKLLAISDTAFNSALMRF